MHDYVRRLVVRIGERGKPMSRNRHFHTFATPLGRRALKISRQLHSVALDILTQARIGGRIVVEHVEGRTPGVRLSMELEHIKARRTTWLSRSEWELLLQDEAVRTALERLERP